MRDATTLRIARIAAMASPSPARKARQNGAGRTIIIGRAILAIALMTRSIGFAGEAAGMHEVEGDCLVSQEGVLFIYAADEKEFARPQAGVSEETLPVGEAEVKAGNVHFSFLLPPGRYCIRCFLDLDGNGRLDRGLFGPTEPWGMSWRGRRSPGFPRFDDVAFPVDRDVRGLRIEVRS
jgi:uncharacterized protein (DUF2141 family)